MKEPGAQPAPHPRPHPALPTGVRWAGWGTATHRHPATWVYTKEAHRGARQKPGQALLKVNESDSTVGVGGTHENRKQGLGQLAALTAQTREQPSV